MAKGGITKGKSHKEGGIPMVVKSTGQKVELEGGEGVINKRNMADTKKHKFDGKELTKCEVVSEINEDYGNGVKIDCDDIVGRKYKYKKGGKIADELYVAPYYEDGQIKGYTIKDKKNPQGKYTLSTKKERAEENRQYLIDNPSRLSYYRKNEFAKGGKTPEYHWFVLDVENDTLINAFEKEYKDDAKEFIDGEVEDDKEYRKNFKIISKKTKEQMGYEYPVKKNVGGYLAIASQIKDIAPKSFDKADEMVADRLPTKPKEIITQWWEVNDDKTNKTLQFSGETLEEAIAKSDKIDFTKYQEGQKVYAKGGEVKETSLQFKKRSEKDSVRIYNAWKKVLDSDFGDKEYQRWEKLVKDTQIPRDSIEKIQHYTSITPRGNQRLIDIYQYWGKSEYAKGGETKRWIKTKGDVNEGSFVEKADKKGMSVKNYAKKVLKDTKKKDDFKVLEDWEDYKASAKGQKEIELRKSAQFVKNIQNFAKGGNIPMQDNYSDKQKSIIRILNKYNYKNLSPQQKAEIYQWNGINDRQLSEELVSKIWGLVLKHLKIEFKDAYVLNAGSGRFWDYSPTLISLNKPKDEKYTICFGNLPKGADKDIFQSRIHDVDKENKADYILGLEAKYLVRRMGKSKYSPTSMILNYDRDFFKGKYERTLGMIIAVREHSKMLRVDGIGVISFYIDKDSFVNLEDFTKDYQDEKPPYKIKESIRVKSNSDHDVFIIVIQKILR